MNKAEQDATSLLQDVQTISRNYQDYSRLQVEIDEEEAKLLQSSSDNRTLEEITAEYDSHQKKR